MIVLLMALLITECFVGFCFLRLKSFRMVCSKIFIAEASVLQ